ncbi:MAG: hypothetical protein GX624_02670 [Actinobacteria bacterium]|nr:hypothetical protein [Actinomycetota bacterium]
MGTTEWIVVVLVVGGRLFLPLLIPYFPVPALLSCLILDSIDQSIFQQFPSIPLDGYQSYDKALDVYYLSVAYLSTLRNWTNQTAFRMSQFLYYYRMMGVVLFELTQSRAVLFIFPNTFEYFFLFVEFVRWGWDTNRMGKWTVILSAAAIWVFIKLPQEWWIHIAKLDMTDFIKESLFGVSATARWSTAVGNRPWVLAAAIALFAVVGLVAYLLIRFKAPAFDHGPRIAANALPSELRGADPYRKVRAETGIWGWQLREKVALTAIISVIFGLMLTGGDASPLRIAVGAAIFTVVNAGVSHAMAVRGRSWRLLAGELVAMLFVNLLILLVLEALDRFLGMREARVPFAMTLFFAYLLTLIVVLYDRFRTVYKARRLHRRDEEAAAGEVSGPAGRGSDGGATAAPA